MKKKNYIVVGCVLVLVLFVVFCFLRNGTNDDAIKFKEEYEALNGTAKGNDGTKYNSVKIDKDNPIKYIASKEALEILDKDEAIVYVGAPWCPWCRNAVPVLFEVAKEFNVDTIYYLELDDEKSLYEVKDGELVKTREGTKSYYKLLDKLSDRLTDYILKDDEGNSLNTNEKRIYMPYVMGIKNGKVVTDHTGTISLDEGQDKYSTITKEQHDELKNIYNNMFEEVFGNNSKTCGVGEVCE